MFKLKPFNAVDASFFTTANFRVTTSIVAKCTPEQVFTTIRGDKVWTKWAPVIKQVDWTCTEPYGLNSTRTVHLTGGLMVKEIFFRWQENERASFYVTEGSTPNTRAFAEDYLVERVDEQHTRLTWTVALQMTGISGLFTPISNLIMKPVFQSWLNRYKAILEQ